MTKKEFLKKGLEVLGDCIFGGKSPSEAVEEQERREQIKVKRETLLPRKYHPHEKNALGYKNIKKMYEKLGVKIAGEKDDLFYEVILPEGWEIKPTSHSMWNELYDNNGNCRATFFYKGAFYDRDAFIYLNQRYAIKTNYLEPSGFNYSVRDNKTGEDLFKTEKGENTYHKSSELMKEECKNFLNEKYPNWEDEFTYWD